MSSDTESEVSSQEEEVQLEPMLNEMESRKKKRLDQLAAARKKSLEVRKEKNEPKKKRIELQAQVIKQLYDVENSRKNVGFGTDCRALRATDGLIRTNSRTWNCFFLSAFLPAAN